MFHLSCNRCGGWTTVLDLSDPDSALKCGCCPVDHHHGQAANACTGADGSGHPGEPCHHPDGGLDCVARTPAGELCSGGHCGPGVSGCGVCRPITITPLSSAVQPARG